MKLTILKLLDMKYVELKSKIPAIKMADLTSYLKNVVLHQKTIHSVNEAAYYILNVKINMVIEHINLNAILDKSVSIETDLNDILKGIDIHE